MISFFYNKNEDKIKLFLMFSFFSNLKIIIKRLKKNKDIVMFRNEVIDNYKSTFMHEDSPYFIKHFNIYVNKCIASRKVSSTLEKDIINMFNEDWRLLSLKIVKEFKPIYLSDL
tara:strand:+ start:659 stop:1000 length:342 start_codon:yes stop_codon:yes gene_type:complete